MRAGRCLTENTSARASAVPISLKIVSIEDITISKLAPKNMEQGRRLCTAVLLAILAMRQ